jgi:energy-coupling factor transporter ATP-binding protein EcfA2
VQLTRLVIHKYRNVVPGTALVFNAGKNVLLGKNATGKSTLLNLLATVARSDFSVLKSEEFALEYEMSSPGWQLHASVRNERKNPLGLEPAALGRSPLKEVLPLVQDTTSSQLEWNLRFTFKTLPTTLRVHTTASGSRVDITRENNTRSIAIESRSFQGDDVLVNCIMAALSVSRDDQTLNDTLIDILTGTVLLTQSRFDESLGFFERMLSQRMLLRRLEARQPFLALAPGVSVGTRMRVKGAVNAEPERVTFDFPNEQLPFLDAAVRQMGFSSGRLKTERMEKRLDENGETLQFGNFSFDFTREDGSAINHSLLSFGQKRLLAFHYYVDCHPHLVIADELVNGLHHQWIENCLGLMGGRQAFLASQNPLLLDYLHFDSAEQARSSFILCRTEKHGRQERLVWSNMAQEDTERFFTAYRSGIQHVSEILRAQGHW